ncbi:MAG: DMT family transporter [Bacillota bacterium]
MEIIGELLAVSNAILYSLSNIYSRRALDRMDKDSGMIITLVVNNVIYGLCLLAVFMAGKWVPLQWGAVFWFVLAGALTSFMGRYLLLESVKVNGPSRAGTYKVASPVFTLFIGMFIIGEQVNRGSLAGALISLAGLYIISSPDLFRKSADEIKGNKAKRLINMGVVIGLASGLSFAVGIAARKVGLQIWPSAVGGAFLGSATAMAITLFSFQVKKKRIPWSDLLGRNSLNYVYSGVCTSVAILCFFVALQFVTVTIANVVASLEPLFTIALSYWILKKRERITKGLVGGAILVSVGAGLIFIY